MMRAQFALNGLEVQIAATVSAVPSAPYTLIDITTLRQGGGRAPKYALIQIGRQGGTVSLTGPVKLIGSCKGRVVELGQLKAGGTIAPDLNLGYQELVQGVGLCTAVLLVPAAITGGGSYNAWLLGVEGSP